jgi:hypothetical protein
MTGHAHHLAVLDEFGPASVTSRGCVRNLAGNSRDNKIRQGTQNMGNAAAITIGADRGPCDVTGSLIVRSAGVSEVALVDGGRDQEARSDLRPSQGSWRAHDRVGGGDRRIL